MKNLIVSKIKEFVGDYQGNSNIKTKWGEPIVGFASAQDPVFNQLKSVVSPTHAIPTDFLSDARTVVAIFFPFEKRLTRTNIKNRLASEEWGIAYVETNEIIRRLSLHIQAYLESRKEKVTIIPATHNWNEEKLISDWSHRHVAYIAGLGNFGLNNMLITRKGCSGRLGSFITTAEIEPDVRDATPNCLYKYNGSCKKCTQRCVNEALFEDSFNRFKCYEILLENVEEHQSIGYADVCGKCLVAIPCSHANPVAKKIQAIEKALAAPSD